MTDYEQQAADFCTKHNVTINAEFVRHGKHFGNDDATRDIYLITIKTDRHEWSFNFGQSIANSLPKGTITYTRVYNGAVKEGKKRIAPSKYDVLACLTCYDPDTHAEFCSNYGYDTDSRKGLTTYLTVQEEWNHVRRAFNSEQLEELQEIN